jgi:putative ABC transport system ATP-binding protein
VFRNIYSVQQFLLDEKEQNKMETNLASRKQVMMPVAERPLIELRKVSKAYNVAAGKFLALKEVDMGADAGEFVAVVGKSGSGKSTLINMITGIDTPTSGEVFVAGTAVHAMDQEQLAVWRGRNVGVVFQFFQLLPTLTVAENIILPMDFCNAFPVNERRARAISLLEKVGIAEQADKLPADLSGGQQQRAAIARALANDPPLIVADEPTGNLAFPLLSGDASARPSRRRRTVRSGSGHRPPSPPCARSSNDRA